MGTHPIFESDFDCLTGQTRFVLLKSLKCVTSLPTFLLNSAVMLAPMLMPSKPSSPAPVQPPLLVPPPRRHPRRRRRRRHPSLKMTIWDSTCSDNIHLC